MGPNITPDDFTQSITVVVSDITDRGTAARSLSHEMKSPITTVVLLADLLGMNDRGHLHFDQVERIGVVQQNADRLTMVVKDFLIISLDIWVDDNALRINVTDEGPGIPQDERNSVFERYNLLDNPGASGNGMGLTMVK